MSLLKKLGHNYTQTCLWPNLQKESFPFWSIVQFCMVHWTITRKSYGSLSFLDLPKLGNGETVSIEICILQEYNCADPVYTEYVSLLLYLLDMCEINIIVSHFQWLNINQLVSKVHVINKSMMARLLHCMVSDP